MIDFLTRINANVYVLVLLAWTCFSSQLFSLEYGLFANNKKTANITKYFVIGERCSGTNYLNYLIDANTYLRQHRIGHKHFPPWYELGPEGYSGNSQYFYFNNCESTLFVIIFRNPYDWLRSFHRTPWHADPSFKKIPFSEFIRKEWIPSDTDSNVTGEFVKNPLCDLDPKTGLYFKNVIALRSAKIRAMLEIKNRAPNVYYVNYEKVRDYPEEVLNEIAELCNIALKKPFTPVLSYKGVKGTTYKPKAYAPISSDDLYYINSQLNKSLEKKIGYERM